MLNKVLTSQEYNAKINKTIPEYTRHKHIAKYLDTFLIGDYNTIEISNQQGGKAGMIKQKKLKELGAQDGTQDIIIHYWKETRIVPIGLYNCDPVVAIIPATLYLEVKRTGKEAREDQLLRHAAVLKYGCPTEVVHDVDETRAALKKHGVPNREIY